MFMQLSPAFDLRERRLALLHELADSFAEGQRAVLAPNLATLESQTARQRDLCTKLYALHRESVPHPANPFTADARQRWESLSFQLQDAHDRVLRCGCLYAAVLRRARFTVNIFCRVLASSRATYAIPVREPATADGSPRK